MVDRTRRNLLKAATLLPLAYAGSSMAAGVAPVAAGHAGTSADNAARVGGDEEAVREARGVISREFGQAALKNVTFHTMQVGSANDTFEYEAANGQLAVRGSSAVAICSGFYQYLKHSHLGIASWSGNRLDLAGGWPDTLLTRVESPYRYRYYLNVVTYGYTMPYWGWERWQREIDWMALHGVNMPLSLNATEAIGERVWRKLGLSQPEIDKYYAGPAYLPWQRMGNIASLDGPLSASWNEKQIALEHRILDRERALGMFPVAQGFAGFVPEGLKKLYPKEELKSMAWGGFAKESQYQSHFLSPDSPLFREIGSLTIKEWESEFGHVGFFLSDSFNEMQIPATGAAAKNAMLARYGEEIYRSIHDGDPNATWVMQGWMFGYMRDVWTPDSVRALLSRVPDEKMLILDEAMDYNADFWRNGMDYDVYDGFWGKQWIGGYIPNMGGKTAFTGNLDFYARGGSEALASKDRGDLVGLGMAPEGIENNDVIYELISDTFWKVKPIDLGHWIRDYSLDRYGFANESLLSAWRLLIHSSYASLVDHPLFSWQMEPGNDHPRVVEDPKIIEAARAFLSASDGHQVDPLYRADAIEMVAMAGGIRADQLLKSALNSYQSHDALDGRKSADRAFSILGDIDRLLASHPTDRLKRWTDFARSYGETTQAKDRYEEDAKRIITLWGPNGEITDYSARMWSGLIGGYYIPRWRMYFENVAGAHHDIRAWEKRWVQSTVADAPRPFADPLAAAKRILAAL